MRVTCVFTYIFTCPCPCVCPHVVCVVEQVRSGSPERPHLGSDPRLLVGGYSDSQRSKISHPRPAPHTHDLSTRDNDASSFNGSLYGGSASARGSNGSGGSSVRLRPFSPPVPTASAPTAAHAARTQHAATITQAAHAPPASPLVRPSSGQQGPRLARQALAAADAAACLVSRAPPPLRRKPWAFHDLDASRRSNDRPSHLPPFMADDDEDDFFKFYPGSNAMGSSGGDGGGSEEDDYEGDKAPGSAQTALRFGVTTFGVTTFGPQLSPQPHSSPPRSPAASAAPEAASPCRIAPRARPLSSSSGGSGGRGGLGGGEFKPARAVGGTFGAPPLAGRFGTSAGYRRHVVHDYNRKVRERTRARVR